MFRRGSGYTSRYRGQDREAADEFQRLSVFAREVPLAFGSLQTGAAKAFNLASAYKLAFDSPWLTSTTSTLTGSQNVLARAGTDNDLVVRLGGLYRVNVACVLEFTAIGASGYRKLSPRVNGSLPSGLNEYRFYITAGDPVPFEKPCSVEFLLNLEDGNAVSWVLEGLNGDLGNVYQGATFNLKGN